MRGTIQCSNANGVIPTSFNAKGVVHTSFNAKGVNSYQPRATPWVMARDDHFQR